MAHQGRLCHPGIQRFGCGSSAIDILQNQQNRKDEMKRWSIVLILSATCTLSAQNRPEVNLEKLMDDIFPVQDEDFNYEELYEMYGLLLAHPINLNTATEEQLQAL